MMAKQKRKRKETPGEAYERKLREDPEEMRRLRAYYERRFR